MTTKTARPKVIGVRHFRAIVKRAFKAQRDAAPVGSRRRVQRDKHAAMAFLEFHFLRLSKEATL